MNILRTGTVVAISLVAVLQSCTTIDLYEKTVPIPGHAWQNSFRPGFDFTIKDTTAPYQLFLVIRHTEKYRYTNIYVNVYAKTPGLDTTLKIQRDLTLATPDKGWEGTGVDDVYEARLKLGEPERLRAGDYKFTIEQIMRENPLNDVLDVGIRVEKKK